LRPPPGAIIIGFNVRADAAARSRHQGNRRGRALLQHHLRGHRRREAGHRRACCRRRSKEQIVGLAEVREVFSPSKFGRWPAASWSRAARCGGNNPIRVLRDNVVIFEGALESLRASRTT
jgi:translation initiation factor IF-2